MSGEWVFFIFGAVPLLFFTWLSFGSVRRAHDAGARLASRGVALWLGITTAVLLWLSFSVYELLAEDSLPFWLSTLSLVVYLGLLAGYFFGFPVKKQFAYRSDVATYLHRAADEIENGRDADDLEMLGDALDDYSEAIAIAPKSWEAHYGTSLALFELAMRSRGSEQRSLLKRAENFGRAAAKIKENDRTAYLLDCISSFAKESA